MIKYQTLLGYSMPKVRSTIIDDIKMYFHKQVNTSLSNRLDPLIELTSNTTSDQSGSGSNGKEWFTVFI